MANGAGRAGGAAPKRVFGLAKELAHRDVSVGLRLAQAARHSKRVREGTGAEARRRGGDSEAGHLKRSALTLEQVARRREGRVLIPGRGHAIYIESESGRKSGVGSGRAANEVGRCRPTPKTCEAVRDAVQSGALVLRHWPAADQRDQIVGVLATGPEANHRAHRVRNAPRAKEAAEHAAEKAAQRLAGAAKHAVRLHARLPITRAELTRAGIISEIGTSQ